MNPKILYIVLIHKLHKIKRFKLFIILLLFQEKISFLGKGVLIDKPNEYFYKNFL